MKKDLLKIINHYGLNEQLKYLQSEMFELNEAVFDAEKLSLSELFTDACYNVAKTFANALKLELIGYKDIKKEHIKEEIADVMVMIKQIQYYYKINDNEIVDIMKLKIDRQLERIKTESEAKENENIPK